MMVNNNVMTLQRGLACCPTQEGTPAVRNIAINDDEVIAMEMKHAGFYGKMSLRERESSTNLTVSFL